MTRATAAEEAVIFLHVPKTAGTTLNRLIEWEYPIFQMYESIPFSSIGPLPICGGYLRGA